MARKHRTVRPSGRTLLLADDDPDYLEATCVLLESEGHKVRCADSGPRALRILREEYVDLVLLDYFMPGMTGEEVVTRLRAFDPYVQVVLQTGYSNEQPPRDMLRKLDIQGYYDKSEGPEKLLLWTDSGLKTADVLRRVRRGDRGLDYVLSTTPALHKLRALPELLAAVLSRTAGLLETLHAASPTTKSTRREPPEADAFIALHDSGSAVTIHAGIGRFTGERELAEVLDREHCARLREVLRSGQIYLDANTTMLPLRLGDSSIGAIYIDQLPATEHDLGVLTLYSNQATLAIQNCRLHELAALDPITGVHTQPFLARASRREVRAAFRSQKPLALLVLRVDNLGAIAAAAGSVACDRALALCGMVLRGAIRDNDLIARHGAEQLVMLFPEATALEAEKIAWRVLAALRSETIPHGDTEIPLHCSLALSDLPTHGFDPADLRRPLPDSYFEQAAGALLGRALEALADAAPGPGTPQVSRAEPTTWVPLPEAEAPSQE